MATQEQIAIARSAASTGSGFAFFSLLPTELRQQIWYESIESRMINLHFEECPDDQSRMGCMLKCTIGSFGQPVISSVCQESRYLAHGWYAPFVYQKQSVLEDLPELRVDTTTHEGWDVVKILGMRGALWRPAIDVVLVTGFSLIAKHLHHFVKTNLIRHLILDVASPNRVIATAEPDWMSLATMTRLENLELVFGADFEVPEKKSIRHQPSDSFDRVPLDSNMEDFFHAAEQSFDRNHERIRQVDVSFFQHLAARAIAYRVGFRALYGTHLNDQERENNVEFSTTMAVTRNKNGCWVRGPMEISSLEDLPSADQDLYRDEEFPLVFIGSVRVSDGDRGGVEEMLSRYDGIQELFREEGA